jgi:hypothetical protein
MEYLLSLPYSRYQVVGIKILPRLAAVLLFYAVFTILYTSGGEDLVALSFFSFTFIYFSLYLISLALSASSENFLVLFVISLFSGYIYYVVKTTPFITGELESFAVKFILFVGFCLLIPLMAAFSLSIKKFDIRPPRVYNIRFIKLFAPLFVLGLLASFFFAYQVVDAGYSSYYLTRDHKLIEFNYNFGFRIYDGKNVHKIQDELYGFYPAVEDNQYVYGTTYGDKILRIDTSDYSIDNLYEAPKGKRFMWGRYLFQQKGLQGDEKIIALLERKRDYSERMLVLLDESLKKIKQISLDTEPVKEHYSLSIFAADQSDGNRFWLAAAWKHEEGTNVFRLWEDGKIEKLGSTQKFPVYINGLLFTYSENEIIIRKEKDGQFETIRRVPNMKDYYFGYGYRRANLSDTQFKEIYGRKYRPREELNKGPMWARLDLETFEIEELSETKRMLYCFGPDEYYFEEKDIEAGILNIYRYQNGQSKLIRGFRISFEKDFHPYEIFESGIVLRRGKKVKVYAFPDLKEIKFKKL